MSFHAQFDPEDVRYIHAHRSPRQCDYDRRTVYFVGVDLPGANGVTLAGTRPAAMRALLEGMLAALDKLDPDRGDQDGAHVPEDYLTNHTAAPPWAVPPEPTTLTPVPAPQPTPATVPGPLPLEIDPDGGEAA